MTSFFVPSLASVYAQLTKFANLGNFWSLFDTVFGSSYDLTTAVTFKSQWQSGSFSQFPQIEVVSNSVLGTANGAYAISTNKIYLSDSFISTASQQSLDAVILEEFGHFVDAQVNTKDTAGDEGELFSALVRGVNLSAAELGRIKAEDDHTVIVVNGQSIPVEKSTLIERVNLVSGTATQTSGTSFPWNDVSDNGRYVAFLSDATNLVTGDTNGQADIFVRDRTTGQTIRASVNSSNVEANSYSYYAPSISSTGQYVAFGSDASNLVANDTNWQFDIFVRDIVNNATTRVNVATGGLQANGSSGRVSISADGRYVVFESAATNLVVNDTNAQTDIFVYDRNTAQTRLVSVGLSGSPANDSSRISNSAISDDGRYIAFASGASNLVSGDTNYQDIFVFDQTTGLVSRVSVGPSGVQSNRTGGMTSSISGDGRYVAFQSSSNNLVLNDTNNAEDIFVHDRTTGLTSRVSVTSSGAQVSNFGSTSVGPKLSNDGRYVAFSSYASGLVAGDTNNSFDIFVYDRTTGSIVRANTSLSGIEANGDSSELAITGDGAYVVFASGATNLVSGDTNAAKDIFFANVSFPASTIVTNTNDSGAGSLRAAINAANSNSGTDTITFNIAGSGVKTITLLSDLYVSDSVIIDGTSQPGFAGTPLIELNGINLTGNQQSGIHLNSGSSTIKGLIFNRFTANGGGAIEIYSAGNVIEGNYIGTDATGTAKLANNFGIEIYSANNRIGGTTAASRNVISGNSTGLWVSTGANNNQILGNYIGTTASGNAALGNSDTGIQVLSTATGNIIGGTTAAARNIISGNGYAGVLLFASGNQIQGNYIGTDTTGVTALGNGRGIQISGSNNSIGGTATGAGNIIAYNTNDGVQLDSTSGAGNQISTNSIFSNGSIGIDLSDNGVTLNDVGDADTGANNLQNFPVLTATIAGSTTTVNITLNSTPNTTFRIELFKNSAADSTGYGEGQTYFGFATLTTDASGNASNGLGFVSSALPLGSIISATATSATNNSTSEFSQAVTVIASNFAPTDLSLSTTTINENVATNTVVGNFSSTDTDAANTFTYSLVSGTGSADNASFSIINGNQLSINASPNYEAKSSYSVRIRTTDQGGLTYEKALTIGVKNLNEAPTNLTLSATSIDENAYWNVPDGTVVGSFSSNDPDSGDTFVYSLVTGTGATDNGAFTIVGNQLQINTAPDYETKSSYSIRVRTTDQGGLFFEKSLTINVNDLNDSSIVTTPMSVQTINEDPLFPLVFSSANGNAITLSDQDAGNSLFSVNLSLLAYDNWGMQYYSVGNLNLGSTQGLSNYSNLYYSISFSGTIAAINNALEGLAFSPSMNWNGSANLQIMVQDASNNYVPSTGVSIHVNPVNDAPNLYLNYIPRQVNENEAFSFSVQGNDLADDNFMTIPLVFTAKLSNGDALPSWISINNNLNSLEFSGTPPQGSHGNLDIVVSVSDGELSTSETFTLKVVTPNNAPTGLALSNSNIIENSNSGTAIGNFSSTDPDTGNTFTYSLVSGTGSTDNALFTISGNQLQSNGIFDFETQNSYSIRVKTTDQGGLSYEKQLTIGISNVDEQRSLFLTPQQDIFINEGLDDTVTGTFANLQQNDNINGGAGIDTLILSGGTSTDELNINASDTTNQLDILGSTITNFERFDLSEFLGNISIVGIDNSNNWLKTGSGKDDLTGGKGNDTLNGGTGADILIGLKGNDTYVVDNTGDIIIENLNSGIDTVESSISWTLKANLENLTLTGTTAINGTGNNLNNTIVGNSANNIINGTAGIDTLTGGAGNDTFVVDTVTDLIDGGVGTDTIQSSVTFSLANALVSNVENLTLTGTANINGTGNVFVNTITGNTGNNILDGGIGNDILSGGTGNDTLNGGIDKDTLTGGVGIDTFVFQFGQSLVSNSDRITDFAFGTDRIDLLTQTGLAINAPTNFSRAANSTATTLQNLVNSVFTDANGAITGNQVLEVNSAALVQVTTAGIAGSYLVINDDTAGFQSNNDLLINITGYSGTLPALGAISVNSFFV